MNSRIALFNHVLDASLRQPLKSSQLDPKAYKTRVKLKILEQRSESTGEKELKFELSRADDFEFLFAEVMNNEKYETLAREHDLTVNFDSFPKVIIQLLRKNIVDNLDEDGENDARKKSSHHSIIDYGKLTEINIILDADRNFCTFELLSKTPMSKGRIFSMKLCAVRGDHLISHLLKICSSQAAKLSNFHKTSEDLESLKTKCGELEEQNSKLEEFKEKYEELSEKVQELEDEVELVREERENIRVLAEEKDDLVADLQADLESLNRELEENKEELEIVAKMLGEEQNKSDQAHKRSSSHQKEISKLRNENEIIRKNFDKLKHTLKQNDLQQSQQSLDMNKLRELEADLKMKDSMVEDLQKKIGILGEELQNERVKTQEATESYEKLKAEHEASKERLQMYRTQRFTSALPTTGLTPLGYRPVLGPDSPYRTNNMSTPFRDATNPIINSSLTPTLQALRFNSHITADDTTGSSLTQTPPVLRNPQ